MIDAFLAVFVCAVPFLAVVAALILFATRK